MNRNNKDKWEEVKQAAEVDKKAWDFFLEMLSLRGKIKLFWHTLFKTRRGLVFYTAITKGYSIHAAWDKLNDPMDKVISNLDSWGWDIAFGKVL